MNEQVGNNPGVQHVGVSGDEAGQRIDNYLMARLKGVPRSRIYRILRKGEVRVNKGRVGPSYKLRAGDSVRIPPVKTGDAAPAPRASDGLRERLEGAVLFENDGVLVLDKPAGMAVHGGSGVNQGVIENLRAVRPDARFLELVHRLDRETSGCLLIAKKRSWLRALHAELREGRVDKRYWALVRGRWQGGRTNAPLQRNVRRSGERVVQVDPEGQAARTRFSALENHPGATLMEAVLDTGRTHQVRVHAAHAGHPLAGDDKYGDDAFNRELRRHGLERLFLHAHHIGLTLPDGGELSVSAPLEPGLQRVLDSLNREDP